MFLALLGILATSTALYGQSVALYGQSGSPIGEDAHVAVGGTVPDVGTPSLLEISLLHLGSFGGHSAALPPLREDSDSDAPLIGAVIGAAAGAVVSILISERSTGSSVVLPLLVLGGVLLGYGVGTAF